MTKYLKLQEVARRLDVSEKTARRYVKSGALPSVFIGGAYRVSEADLERFLENARVDPGKVERRSSLEESFDDVLNEERRKVQRKDIYDVVREAARQQVKQDTQAANRAVESGRAQAYFMRHENEALHRLLEYPTDEVASVLIEVMYRQVLLEERLREAEAAADETAEKSRSGSA